jgi:integrase
MRKNEAKWIEKRKRWQINVQSDGQRRTFQDTTPGTKGKVLCEQKADKWVKDKLVDENTRAEVLLDRWYKKLQISTSYSNHHQYDGYIRNWIKPVIGTRKIGRLTQNACQEVIDNAYSKGDLSEKTLSNIRGCLMAFIKYCRGEKATALYPETLSIPSSAKKSVKTIASPNDITILFAKSTTFYRAKTIEDRFIHAYRFCVLTGMRPGELIGLQNQNINGKKVKITQSINDYGEITQGKNRNARRTYTLDDHALKVLQDQKLMLMKMGQISSYVFPDKNLNFIQQYTFRNSWKRYCLANRIQGAKTPYELRHTFVSVNTEMPEALKKMVMGHAKDMDTDGVYGHEKADDMDRAAEYISAAFKKLLGW